MSSHAPSTFGCTVTLTEQCGTAVMTIPGGSSGVTGANVIFSPSFSSTPTIVTGIGKPVTLGGGPVAVSGAVTSAGFVPTNTTKCTLAACAGLTDFVNNWDNMPAAPTEVFGDTLGEHRLFLDFTNAATFRIGVNCFAESTSASAYLKVQYSTNAGGTWADLDGTTGQDFILGSNAPNGCGTSPWADGSNGVYTAVPALAQTSHTWLRVVGVNGGGAGDQPLFSQVWIEYTVNTSLTSNNICTALAVPTITPKVSFTPKVFCNFVVGASTTFNVFWIASI